MGKALDAWREQTGKTKPQGAKAPTSSAEAERIAMRNYGAVNNPILSALSISPAPVSVKPVYDRSADRRREEDKPQNRIKSDTLSAGNQEMLYNIAHNAYVEYKNAPEQLSAGNREMLLNMQQGFVNDSRIAMEQALANQDQAALDKAKAEYDAASAALKATQDAQWEQNRQNRIAAFESGKATGANDKGGALRDWNNENIMNALRDPTKYGSLMLSDLSNVWANMPLVIAYMTPEERATALRLGESGDTEGMREYIDLVSRDANKRRADWFTESVYQGTKDAPGGAIVARSVAAMANLGGLAAPLKQTIKNAATGEDAPIDYNSFDYSFSQLRDATARGLTDGIESPVGQFAAQTGLSLADFLAQALTGPVAPVMMAGNAASDKSYELAQRGVSAEKTLALSALSGAIEAATEKMGLDNMMKLLKGGGKPVAQFVKGIAMQAGIEAGEETIAEYANTLAENAILGDESAMRQYANQMMAQGMSKEEAEKKAFSEYFLKNPALAALGGAISGGVVGGGAQFAGGGISPSNSTQNPTATITDEAADSRPGAPGLAVGGQDIENRPPDNSKSGVTVQDGITAMPDERISDFSIPQNEAPVNPEERSVGAAPRNMTPYTALQNQYGIMPEGENPARVAPVPNRGGDGRSVMQTARNVVEAEATPDARVEQVEQLVTQGKLGYDSVTNQQLVDEAVAQLQDRGWRDSVREWTRAVDQGKVSDKLVAMGAVILNNAGNSDVSAAEYADLVVDYATLLDNASKGLQAARILKRLSPEWKLYGIQKSINRLAQEYAGKYQFTLSDSLIAEYRAAKTDAERDVVIGKMQKHVADQVPSSAADKFVALRYVNMLGNFKTQVRNVLSNAAMLAVASTKRRVEGALQAAWNAVAKKHGVRRTSALAPGKARRDAARADFDRFKRTVMGQNRYIDNGSPSSLLDIERDRTIFKNNGTWGTTETSPWVVRAARKATDLGDKALEAYRKVTNWAIEEGDAIFSKANYVDALSGWMKANGITAEQWNSGQVDSKTMDEARAFAIKEAQEATFRDSNDFANWVSRIGRRKDTPKAARLIGEGTLPFRKTLANVAVRFEEYSPLGLLNTAVDAARAQKQDSDVTGNDVINSLSKSLVGSAIFGLGWILAKKGLLTGGDDDDNMQDYSLVVPGKGEFSLSWLSPTAVPLFMGAQLYNMTQDDELSWADIDEVIAEAIDPIMEMSIASGVRDALDDARYAENNLAHTLIKGALSYLLQGLTNTGLGQIERTFEQYRQTTTPDKDSNVPAWLQREVGQASAKTPGVDLYQADYIDEWGRKQDNGGWLLRAVNNILNPGNVSKAEQDPIILEAIDLYNKGYKSALPSKPASNFSYVDKSDQTESTINLDAQEYQAFLENVGGIRHDMAQEMMDSYGDLPDGIKEEILKDAYSYALAEGKAGVSSYERDGQDALLHELGTEDGVTYLAYKAAFEAALEGDAESYLDMIDSFDEQSDAVQEALNKVSLFKTTYAAIEAGYDLDKIEEAREIIGSVNGKDENGKSVSGLKQSRAWEKAYAAGFSKDDFDQLYKILG